MIYFPHIGVWYMCYSWVRNLMSLTWSHRFSLFLLLCLITDPYKHLQHIQSESETPEGRDDLNGCMLLEISLEKVQGKYYEIIRWLEVSGAGHVYKIDVKTWKCWFEPHIKRELNVTWSQVSRIMTSSVARSSWVISPGTSSIYKSRKRAVNSSTNNYFDT